MSPGTLIERRASMARKEHLTAHEQSRQEHEHLHGAQAQNHEVHAFGHNEIAALAHDFWSARGCPEGSADEDWFHAVKELRSRAIGH